MINAEARAKAAALMGYLVQTAGRIEGRVRLQKSLYLLQRKGAQELEPFAFVYHHYGPYSEGLAGLLEESVLGELIKQGAQRFDDEWQRFEYLPGPRAGEYFDLVSEPSRSLVDDVVNKTRGAHWRTLELAATADFLRRKGRSPAEAMSRALQLKPACGPYEKEAGQLLGRLALD